MKIQHVSIILLSWASAEGGRGAVAFSIFIHGTDILDRGLIVLFFGLFSVAHSPVNFSADAFGSYAFHFQMLIYTSVYIVPSFVARKQILSQIELLC